MPASTDRVRIAIVDDHPVARYGMRMIFASDPRLDVVCAVGSVPELCEHADRTDVAILDLYLAGGRLPVSEIAALTRRFPVLVVSASARQADVLAAIRAGAGGYLTKSSDREAFVAAVRDVAAGGFYISSHLADLIDAGGAAAGPPGTAVELAPRERETISLIAQGFTQAQAASRLGVSPATIDTYIKRIRRKLGPGNKADLTRRAIELGQTLDPLEGPAAIPPRTAQRRGTGPGAECNPGRGG
jgi:DNA-binding NarL/FixJ family response regulator